MGEAKRPAVGVIAEPGLDRQRTSGALPMQPDPPSEAVRRPARWSHRGDSSSPAPVTPLVVSALIASAGAPAWVAPVEPLGATGSVAPDLDETVPPEVTAEVHPRSRGTVVLPHSTAAATRSGLGSSSRASLAKWPPLSRKTTTSRRV
jgi:hypothetical protein